jgi:hypothetical protein
VKAHATVTAQTGAPDELVSRIAECPRFLWRISRRTNPHGRSCISPPLTRVYPRTVQFSLNEQIETLLAGSPPHSTR